MNNNEPLSICYRILGLIQQTEDYLSSARRWGFVDILGGGMISGLFKHSKINHAKTNMDQIRAELQLLADSVHRSKTLRIELTDADLGIGDFATFADFVFDGIFADVIVQSKIADALKRLQKFKSKIQHTADHLEQTYVG